MQIIFESQLAGHIELFKQIQFKRLNNVNDIAESKSYLQCWTPVLSLYCFEVNSSHNLSVPEATDFHDYKEREREVWMACFDPPINCAPQS